jgi:integrase
MALRKVCTKCRKTEAKCKCSSPTWRYQIDYYDPTGKRVRRDYEKKKDAVAELGKRVSLIAEGSYLDVKKEYKTTLKELLEKYKENYQQQASYKSWKSYCHKNFKEYFGEDTLLANISYMDVETYRNHLRQKLTKNGSLRKDATVNRGMSCLSHLFTKAKEWKLIERHPFEDGKSLLLKEDNERVRYLEEDELQALLAECPKHLERIVICAVNTGMDRGELLRLKWEQIQKGFIHLPVYKTRPARKIPVNGDLEQLFKEIRMEQGPGAKYVFTYAASEDKLKGKRPVRKRKGPVPVPGKIKNIKTAFNSALSRAGIVNFRFKDLRHTFASHMVMRGATMKELQELMGHRDMKMTNRYAHLSPEHKKKAVNLLNGLTAPTKKADSHEIVTNSKSSSASTDLSI